VSSGQCTLIAALTLFLGVGGCDAGPSAFDRSGRAQGPGPEDTADVAELPHVPEAADVEPQLGDETLATEDSVEVVVDSTSDAVTEAAVTGAAAARAARAGAAGAGRFPRPEHVRGLYLNAWAAGSRTRMDAMLELAKRTEVNSFVIDIKDATGYVSHRTAVPLAQEIGATGEIRIRDLPGLLDRLEAEGIYPIARIVIVKDPLLSKARPELAVQDTAGGVFVDGKGIVWLNPYNRDVWDYHVDLAREVVAMGFPEIQWDYVRFPDIPRSDKDRAVYPGSGDQPMAGAIHDLLAHSREVLSEAGALVTADVFGVTTTAKRDVGIGQVWESIIDAVDVALPMVYPSHYWTGSFGIEKPNAYPYEVVRWALEDALERSAEVEGAGLTRPWLQDFSLGQPRYEAPEVRAQIQATYDAGIQEWILWNPGARYSEGALEPVGGFENDPLIRLAGGLVPVGRRWERLDSATVRPPVPVDSDSTSVVGDSAGAAIDTSAASAGAVSADTIPAG